MVSPVLLLSDLKSQEQCVSETGGRKNQLLFTPCANSNKNHTLRKEETVSASRRRAEGERPGPCMRSAMGSRVPA